VDQITQIINQVAAQLHISPGLLVGGAGTLMGGLLFHRTGLHRHIYRHARRYYSAYRRRYY
jgi:hypothetical protein